MPYADPEIRRAYFARRNKEPARQKRKSTRNYPRNFAKQTFYAIDSEGGNFERIIERDDKRIQPHKSFLWGCASDDNKDDEWLFTGKPLDTEEICMFLREQKERANNAIFISFAFGYDVAQILSGLPYEKAWEIQRETDFNNPNDKPETNRITIWNNWGFSYRKGKSFSLYWFDKSKPYYVLDKKGISRLNAEGSIRIYDVFGFFQASFLKSLRTMPGTCSEVEYAIVKQGKSDRGNFLISDIDNIKEYTKLELILLCRMMNNLRTSMLANNIRVTTWFGAGSIASALLKRERTRQHLGSVMARNPNDEQIAAHHAYFGGRIELLQQGATNKPLYSYDISSAYPFAATLLSSMSGSTFTLIKHPTANEIRTSDALSLIRVRAIFPPDRPFYPLPYRMPNGAILFPREVFGWYMRDELLGALDYIKQLGGKINAEVMYRFLPTNDEKPFAFLQSMFDYRASLPKTDITQIVIKLGINSVYGKTAQRIGQFGKVPAHASPWYAAAITAKTRSQLLTAALHDPDAIVMLATDGIISTRPLPLDIPPTKRLGGWEAAILPEGGVFVQSGVYAISGANGEWSSKSRGFRPENIDGSVTDFIRQEIPRLWRKDEKLLPFPYRNYATLGAATVSRDAWRTAGNWIYGSRELNLRDCGVKRSVSTRASRRRARAHSLVATWPNSANELLCDDDGNIILSAASSPAWLDLDYGLLSADENEQEQILAGMS